MSPYLHLPGYGATRMVCLPHPAAQAREGPPEGHASFLRV